MALNSSGPISLNSAIAGQSVSLEIGMGSGVQIDMLSANVRTLTGIASGPIRLPNDFYGKVWRPALSYTFSANTTNASLNVASISGYIAGVSDIVITINSGIWVYSTSTSTPGLTLSGGITGDTVKIVNNGYIAGMGGAGTSSGPGGAGAAGGTALSLGFNTTIDNTNASAYIGGGGGGGGAVLSGGNGAGGGGAGGGAGGATSGNSGGNAGGGSGGAPGVAGSNGGDAGATNTYGRGGGAGGGGATGAGISYASGGGGGGRIFPGTGGAGGNWSSGFSYGGTGGSANGGGGAGYSAGSVGGGGGGGGWGASGGASWSGSYAGGAGGKAVALNGKSVTWVSGNTTRVYGSIS
jgi:hypothetical protein